MADENDEPVVILQSTDEEDNEDDEYLPSEPELEHGGDLERDKRRRIEALEASSPEDSSQQNELNFGEVDGLICPICMEAWTNDGDHHICCLPCGHVYGMSCINRWLKQRKNQGKCPQCNRKCAMKDVRKLFASQLVAVDEKLQKRIQSLEAKCASHEKRVDWKRKESKWRMKEADMQLKIEELTERATCLEGLIENLSNGPSATVNAIAGFLGNSATGTEYFDSEVFRKESPSHFMLQEALEVDGAHLFDIDASDKILLIARSLPGISAKHLLTKMSLIYPHGQEDILLPPMTNLIKDVHFSPSNDGLALFTSVGKKLSLLSMENNRVVLAYDLPVAGWTCSWDLDFSHHVYAGLQNGSVFMFDKRQTRGPLKFIQGLTSYPIHTLYSLSNSSNSQCGGSSVLSASSSGLCLWNFDSADEGVQKYFELKTRSSSESKNRYGTKLCQRLIKSVLSGLESNMMQL